MHNYSLGDTGARKNTNCITGNSEHLYQSLKTSIANASKIDIIVAFIMESGVRILQQDLKDAAARGIRIRLLCGNYLNITQPQALYLLKDTLGNGVDLRFYNVPRKSFHPKAYIFEHLDFSEMFVGSSNISRSALTDGVEWNYRIDSRNNDEDLSCFRDEFERLFLNYSLEINDKELKRYSKNWKKPRVFEDIERSENEQIDASELYEDVFENKVAQDSCSYKVEKDYSVVSDDRESKCCILPIGPQIEALYELKKTRAQGWDRGIVVAATGVGKTFLAAFDSEDYKRILFIAHREEILKQAEETFKSVNPKAFTGFFMGEEKNPEAQILFATVQTLGKEDYLRDEYFKYNDFDYIIIDEFHHAAANTYRKIIEYFKPKFLLGLTATPERLDNQDVFSLCDYNLVYEIRLKEAINKGWLVPFRYYGVFDETNFNNISYKNGKYDDKQLEKLLCIKDRGRLILEHYEKYNSKRALGFCSGRNHALFMAEYFNSKNIKSCAVISGDIPIERKKLVFDRSEALDKLRKGEIRVVFSVDMFNEGVDIPAIDMVMLLRPTESPVVFMQQLGRGLRRFHGKKYLNVLDFIGNYKKANLVPFFLSGEIRNMDKRAESNRFPVEEQYPDNCIVNFDLRIIDLFKKMALAKISIFERVKEEYFRIKEYVGMKPLRLDMYTYMDEELCSVIRRSNETNIFKDYLGFLKSMNDLNDEEEILYGTFSHDFFKMLENTGMTRTYKMPLLLSFYNNGDLKLEINDEDIFQSFKKFYSIGSHAFDILRDKNSKNFEVWGKREYLIKAKNPIEAFGKTEKDYFYGDENSFKINSKLNEFLSNPAFISHFKDIISFRTKRFFKERLEKIIEENERMIE